MQVRKIFLASSAELKDDRRAFELMLNRLSQQWRARDFVFDLVVWEDFIDSMSKEGLQAEYNKAALECDVFVMLFFTKVGRFTQEEFDTVFSALESGAGPRIYTYFRNDFILSAEIDDGIKSLLNFKARLRELKHYVTHYRSAEDLQYQFSRQLELLYGDSGPEALDVNDKTSPYRVGEIALLLTYRHLFGSAPVDGGRMAAAIERAGRQVRNTIYQMASEMRRETWFADKRLMERTIPVFEALTRSDPSWHGPWGQLGYSLVDRVQPEWARAREVLDRAVALRGDHVAEGLYYHYNRARCVVQLDPGFAAHRAADPATREAVVAVLREARRDLDTRWDTAIEWASSESLKAWLVLNGSPRLR